MRLRDLIPALRGSPALATARQTHHPAHMTWASGSISHSLSRTRVFLKKQLWAWPLIAIALMSLLGYWVRNAVESTARENLKSQLETLLTVESSMVEGWLNERIANVESLAESRQARDTFYQLLTALEGAGADSAPAAVDAVATDASRASPPSIDAPAPTAIELRRRLDTALAPFLGKHGFVGYVAYDKDKRIVASTHAELIGGEVRSDLAEFVGASLAGEANSTPPFAAKVPMPDADGVVKSGLPVMFVAAPIRDADFQVIGALALRMRPEEEFTRILQLGRIGATGESYAFDNKGLLVSNSRFDDEMILLGILPENQRSILNVELRDPGGDMTTGFRPKVRRSQLPLTRMAETATTGKSATNVDGYRDYRGVPVVGAWKWLPQRGIGIAVKQDAAEAYRPLRILQWTMWSLYGLLGLASLALFVFTVVVHRLRRAAQKAEVESQQLGQYTLERKLGSGAMGVVYQGRHTMLRRPTAIKMLEPDKMTEAAIQRFEKEVQTTSQLNNPNTVAIYDYGRTPEGVFYYAMEYLDGIDLQSLVDRYGPQPPGRVIRILTQMCGSLYEAHSLGLVHRDIKPANVMLNRRGGEPDVAKVLDFGLVKAIDEQGGGQQGMTGTPLYMSPEAIQLPGSIDPRSDIYAVGAVGYFLLTGAPVFRADSIVDLCQMHIEATPKPPSQRSGQAIPPDLEHAILACLEKSRARRPQTARDLSQMLARGAAADDWAIDDAEAWWGRHERGLGAPPSKGPPTKSSQYEMTIDQS